MFFCKGFQGHFYNFPQVGTNLQSSDNKKTVFTPRLPGVHYSRESEKSTTVIIFTNNLVFTQIFTDIGLGTELVSIESDSSLTNTAWRQTPWAD